VKPALGFFRNGFFYRRGCGDFLDRILIAVTSDSWFIEGFDGAGGGRDEEIRFRGLNLFMRSAAGDRNEEPKV